MTDKSSADEIFEAFGDVEREQVLYNENLKLIRDILVKQHGFALSDVDLSGLEYVYSAFSQFGQKIQYSSTGAGFGGGRQPSYAELMTATDADSVSRSYLASEENFRFLKALESKNLLVPVVGNFAGPRRFEPSAETSRTRAARAAFYLSMSRCT